MSFAFLYWDPNSEAFTIPFIHLPILWYGLFFALGFIVGFPIFVGVVERFFLERPDFEEREILGDIPLPWLQEAFRRGKAAVVKALNEWLTDPKEMLDVGLSSRKSLLGFVSSHSQAALRRLKLEQMFPKAILSLRKQASLLTDRITLYMIIATIVGARVGHYLFYEKPSSYFQNLPELFNIWRMRGLASHGALIAIVFALGLFGFRHRAKLRGMTWLHLLDFVCVPAALAGAFIRVGNFFNQEILGKPSQLPWAVIFGFPADGSEPMPRHPVQLYEAVAYCVVFVILWKLSFRSKALLQKGTLLGWFLVLIFGSRFIIEFWKEEQSLVMPSFLPLTMGQLLSIPALVVGLGLLVRTKFSVWDKKF